MATAHDEHVDKFTVDELKARLAAEHPENTPAPEDKPAKRPVTSRDYFRTVYVVMVIAALAVLFFVAALVVLEWALP